MDIAARVQVVAAVHNSQSGGLIKEWVLCLFNSVMGWAKLDGVGAGATTVDIGLNPPAVHNFELRGPENHAVRGIDSGATHG